MSTQLHNALSGLNPVQKEAVLASEGPVLVVAGAGSGKTKVLTHRIAYLIDQGVVPGDVLAVTFTNKAAEEMRQRVGKILGRKIDKSQQFFAREKSPWIGTFHSLCAFILRQHAERLGYPKTFSIFDESDQSYLIKSIMKDLGISSEDLDVWSVREKISWAKSNSQDPEQFLVNAKGYFQKKIARIYERYQDSLRAQRAMDFDDLLSLTLVLFNQHADILRSWQARFRYILVDEYQDTNMVQYQIVRLLAAAHRNLFVVGDVDQSIYSWRGADFRNVFQFETDFPGARVITLEENYRSTQNILDAANALIAHNVLRKEKNLWTSNERGPLIKVVRVPTERAEAGFVIDEIIRLRSEENVSLGNVAVFYRTNAQSRILEEYCIDAGISYQVVGSLKFFERKEIKDVTAWARFILNNYDTISLERALKSVPLGLGDATAKEVVDFLFAPAETRPRGSLRRVKSLQKFKELYANLSAASQSEKPSVFLRRISEETGYKKKILRTHGSEGEARLENLEELFGLAQSFDGYPVPDGTRMFFEHVTLMSAQDALGSGERLSLMTVHAAKGLEYGIVFLVGMEDGLFPHERSVTNPEMLEEERRLCYVGITRAKKMLYLLYARTRFILGTTSVRPQSRFLEEIPPGIREEVDLDEESGGSGGYLDEFIQW